MKPTVDVREREQDLLATFDDVWRQGQTLVVEGLGNRVRRPLEKVSSRIYSLAHWTDIVAYHPADLVVTVEAGITISALNQVMANHAQWLPLTVADGQDDTVGGAVAAGVDGIWRGGYGPFRDRVLGLRVLTPGFGAIQAGSKVVKSVAGYNLPRIFMGSRGSLGVITQVTLKVSPRPKSRWNWVWQGELRDMVAKADELMGWAAPWASIALISDPRYGVIRLWAEWHGVAETVDYLVQMGGPGAPDLPLLQGTWSSREVTLKGAVPRRIIGDFIRTWQDGPLVVEWQSGGFMGSLSESGAQRMMYWIRERSGGVEVLSGPGWEQPMAPSLARTWRHLKDAYDPHAILGQEGMSR